MTKIGFIPFFPLLLLLLPGCQHHRPLPPVEQCLQAVAGESRQAVVVEKNDNGAPFEVTIRLYERSRRGWHPVGAPIDGTAGRNGLAPAGEKREGDGRTPSGAFALERAFGYSPLQTGIPYIVLDPEMVWIDEPKSPLYNMLATRGEAMGLSHEVMRRDDHLYKYGVVVEYNTKHVVPGAGSAIFLHLWHGPGVPTTGCVAAAEADILTILRWLDPAKKPFVVIGVREGCSTSGK